MSKGTLTIKTSVVAVGDDSKPEWHTSEIDMDIARLRHAFSFGLVPSYADIYEKLLSLMISGNHAVVSVMINGKRKDILFNHTAYNHPSLDFPGLQCRYDLRDLLVVAVRELLEGSDVLRAVEG